MIKEQEYAAIIFEEFDPPSNHPPQLHSSAKCGDAVRLSKFPAHHLDSQNLYLVAMRVSVHSFTAHARSLLLFDSRASQLLNVRYLR